MISIINESKSLFFFRFEFLRRWKDKNKIELRAVQGPVSLFFLKPAKPVCVLTDGASENSHLLNCCTCCTKSENSTNKSTCCDCFTCTKRAHVWPALVLSKAQAESFQNGAEAVRQRRYTEGARRSRSALLQSGNLGKHPIQVVLFKDGRSVDSRELLWKIRHRVVTW